ncbi:hypothetical protein [Streptomyces sp. JHA26]|nr:hypothetical protein [Streptomyces sp. JHA26]
MKAGTASRRMFAPEGPARALMRTPLPDGSGHIHGPEFRRIEDES